MLSILTGSVSLAFPKQCVDMSANKIKTLYIHFRTPCAAFHESRICILPLTSGSYYIL